MKLVIAIFVAFMLMLGSNTADAAKCKYIEPHTEMIVLGKKEQQRLLASPRRWTRWKGYRTLANQAEDHAFLNGIVEDDNRYLGLKVVLVEHSPSEPKPYELSGRASIPAGAKLLILLADESIIELTAYADVAGTSRHLAPREGLNSGRSDHAIYTTLFAKFLLDDEKSAALSAQGVTDIRVSTSMGDRDFNFGKKPSDRIQEIVACL